MAIELKGKKGIVFGVSNEDSIAWACAKQASDAGAELVISCIDRRLVDSVKKLIEDHKVNATVSVCNAVVEEDLNRVFEEISQKWGELDFVVHSIAFAKKRELQGEFINTSQFNFQISMETSVYTLTTICRAARPLLKKSEAGGSVITMTYLGSERVMQGYNVMGVAKAALEASMRYLAADLGPDGIRVNAISAGPVSTTAARAITRFPEMLEITKQRSPLKRCIDTVDVANAALFLMSDMSRSITGDVMFVDAGYHVMGI
ncbi:MAG: enoyl-ACP reductase [Candidatus Omnitrophica bacterium]|nr:enoyl-ACP reductase [Candidatus Omnitrophota bacterium]